MNDWIILGIEKTSDLRKVKQAYAEKTKLYHPETHPDEFRRLHDAYKRISAEIRGSVDYQQQIQIQNPEAVREAEKQFEGVAHEGFWQNVSELDVHKQIHKPIRNINRDEDFLKQVEDAAKNFAARHTDKRDPVQVAKVEYILQHDDRNSKLLQQFQWLLYNEFFKKGWRNFFVSGEFLERQYEPEFINGMVEILKSRVLEIQRVKAGSFGLGVLEYFIIVYGSIFEGIDCLQLDKHIYRKELLQGLVDVIPSNYEKRTAYQQIESSEELLEEQYAFFLYRSILEELDAEIPANERIKEVMSEGFRKANTARIFFDLLIYLLSSERKNITIFRMLLTQVCEMEWNSSIQDEIEIIKLELQEAEQKKITEKRTSESKRTEVQTTEVKISKKQKEDKLIRTIGKWMIGIALVILCINIICRFEDAEKSKEHIRVTGTVSKIQESTEWARAGNRTVNSSTYTVWVHFQPKGWLSEDIITEDFSEDMFSVGDTVSVLYPEDTLYKAYVAKKDWMTGAYLPISKWYNIPLIISIILFVTGSLFCMNSPILKLITSDFTIVII